MKTPALMYQVVHPHPKSTQYLSLDELLAQYTVKGYESRQYVKAELIGQPKLAGFNGPMMNGYKGDVAVIRYEHPNS